MREVTTLPACLMPSPEAANRVLVNCWPEHTPIRLKIPGCLWSQYLPQNPGRPLDVAVVLIAELVGSGRRREAEMLVRQWRGAMPEEDRDLLASLVGMEGQ